MHPLVGFDAAEIWLSQVGALRSADQASRSHAEPLVGTTEATAQSKLNQKLNNLAAKIKSF